MPTAYNTSYLYIDNVYVKCHFSTISRSIQIQSLLQTNSKINQNYKYSCDSHKTLLVPNEETVNLSQFLK